MSEIEIPNLDRKQIALVAEKLAQRQKYLNRCTRFAEELMADFSNDGGIEGKFRRRVVPKFGPLTVIGLFLETGGWVGFRFYLDHVLVLATDYKSSGISVCYYLDEDNHVWEKVIDDVIADKKRLGQEYLGHKMDLMAEFLQNEADTEKRLNKIQGLIELGTSLGVDNILCLLEEKPVTHASRNPKALDRYHGSGCAF